MEMIEDDIVSDMQDKFTFSTAYLKSKNVEDKTGVIEVVYVYYPLDDDGKFQPQCIDGFNLTVNLPFDGTSGIDNFIKSPAAEGYLRQWFLVKILLWIQTLISMIIKERDMTLAKSNQMMEGSFRNDKHVVTKLKQFLHQPGMYMHYCYENLDIASKYLMVEMNVTVDSLAKRKENLKGLKEKEEKN